MSCASAATGLLLRSVSDVPPWGELIVVSLIAVAVARFVAERQESYSLPVLLDPLGHILDFTLCLTVAALASVGTIALLHDHTPDLPYLVTEPFAWALSSGAALLSFRSLLAWKLQSQAKAGRLTRRVALIGANEASMRLMRDAATDSSISIIGIFDDRASRLPANVRRSWIRGDVGALVKLARDQAVDAVVISLPLSATDRIAEMRRRLAGIATDVFLTTDTGLLSAAGAQFTMLGGSPVLSVSSRPLKDWPAFKKSVFDRVAGCVFLLSALPVMALIALAVRLDSPGPILFRQNREGLNGASFSMLKFRTMRHGMNRDESVQATANDSRVTRTGYWLRRFSLDELPQLWNVIRGDMSLVGPRPHLATTRAGDRLFSEIVPHYQARHRMKPGLTGWAQVQGFRGETRTEQDIADRVKEDLFYIDNWSLGLDLRIIGRTLLREVVSRSGRAY